MTADRGRAREAGLGRLLAALGLLLALPSARALAAGSSSLSIQVMVGYSTGPADITDLVAVPGPQDGSIQLTWTEPGATAYSGTASSYTVRVSTIAEIGSNADFNNPALALPLSSFTSVSTFSPGPGGSLATELLTRLTPGVTYYFAIRATNDNSPPQTDTWSRDASSGRNASNFARAPDTPPSPPTGVSALSLDQEVRLSWSSNTEWDLAGYRLWRSSGPAPGAFGLVATSTSTAFDDLGLVDGVTYYYRVSAFNFGVPPMESALSATATGYPGVYTLPVSSVTIGADARDRQIALGWINPNPAPTLTLILREAGSPPAQAPTQLVGYSTGTLLGGATVAYVGSGSSFTDGSLPLDATYYYALYAQNHGGIYSVGVTTAALLHLKDMPPAGLDLGGAGTQSSVPLGGTTVSTVTLVWQPVVAREDGSPLHSPPTPKELTGYRIYRSTSLWAPTDAVWTLPVSSNSLVDPTGAGHYYKLTAVDGFGQESAGSLWISGDTGDQYATTPDREFLLHLLHAGVPALNDQKATVGWGWQGQDLGGRVLQSYAFTPYRTDNGQDLANSWSLPADAVDVKFYYQIVGQQLQFTKLSTPNPVRVNASDAANLGIYWFNGAAWIKLYGSADPTSESIGMRGPYLGKFQVRELERTQQFAFDPSTISNRFLTPNGDGRNDTVVFTVSNPADVEVTGKIFDTRGGFVADMPYNSNTQQFTWDGKSNGVVVPGGVYLYQIQAGAQVYTGTVVVIK